jgi:thiol-disulfide isomerase/thioredoxin
MNRIGLLLCLAWLIAAAAPAGAAGLDVRAELARLEPIRGPAVSATLEDRVVLVAFFASWCPPCRAELGHLNAVQDAYRDAGLEVIGINVFETLDGRSSPAGLAGFLDQTAPVFAILKGDRATRQAFFDLDRIPSIFLFARDGRLAMVFRHERGATKTHLSEAELRAAVEALL